MTGAMTETPIAPIVGQYLAVFNETDPAARRDLIVRTVAADATGVDPVTSSSGHDGIDAITGDGKGQVPGHEYRLSGTVNGYADRLWFR